MIDVLRRGIDAADPAGRPLFAGLAGREWPSDEYGQLWRACDILREHRGDSHVAACVAGVFSVDDAIRVVCERARLMQDAPPGRMA